jgi:hypothetical protein
MLPSMLDNSARFQHRARQAMIAVAVGRLGLGVVVLAAPRAVRLLLPGLAEQGQTRMLVRMLAGRDLALGLATLRVLRSNEALGALAVVGALSDLADGLGALSSARAMSASRWVPSAASGLGSAAVCAACAAVLLDGGPLRRLIKRER